MSSVLRKAHAQVSSTLDDPLGFGTGTDLADIFGLITNIVLGVGIALTAIFLIIGGIQYVTSRGDAKAAEQARGSLTNAVIGFVVILGAFTIRFIVNSLLGGDDAAGDTLVVPTGL